MSLYRDWASLVLGTAGRPEESGLVSLWLNAGHEPAACCSHQLAAKGAFCKCSDTVGRALEN